MNLNKCKSWVVVGLVSLFQAQVSLADAARLKRSIRNTGRELLEIATEALVIGIALVVFVWVLRSREEGIKALEKVIGAAVIAYGGITILGAFKGWWS